MVRLTLIASRVRVSLLLYPVCGTYQLDNSVAAPRISQGRDRVWSEHLLSSAPGFPAWDVGRGELQDTVPVLSRMSVSVAVSMMYDPRRDAVRHA